jgi:excisionase family DNA binding protein
MDASKRRAYRIDEVCALTGLGRTSIYAAIKHGDLLARKAGRSTIILSNDLDVFLQNLPKSTAIDHPATERTQLTDTSANGG